MASRLTARLRSRLGNGPGREPTALARDDAGVVAIVVALSIATFLVGFAALAVDLGQAYVRQSEVQGIADRLALAGAQELPDTTKAVDAVSTTLTQICVDEKIQGVCDVAADWTRNNTLADGEVEFYADQGQQASLADLNQNGTLDVGDALAGDPAAAAGLRVTLPPSIVQFGLAGTFGSESTTVVRSATARIGTPLGAGILPFALTQQDLDRGQFCVRDPLALGGGGQVPSGPNIRLYPSPFALPGLTFTVDPAGGDITVYLLGGRSYRNVQFFRDDDPDLRLTSVRDPLGGGYTVTIPAGDPGTTINIYATGTVRARFSWRYVPFVSQLAEVTYRGTLPPSADLCDQPDAIRGVIALARSGVSGTDAIEANVRQSPQVKLYPQGGILGTLSTTLQCVSLTFSPASNCLSTKLDLGFATQLTDGLLDSAGNAPGRLTGSCTDDPAANVLGTDIDGSRLLNGTTPLLDTSKGGSSNALLTQILAGRAPSAADEGWVTSRALKCPRLAMLPVVDPNPLNGVIGGQNIVSFTYVWIDQVGSTGRGLNVIGGEIGSFHGYVVDPRYLPAEVAGSGLVGPYLGAYLPKEALLIHDLGAPAT